MISWKNITEQDFELAPTKDSEQQIFEKTAKLIFSAVEKGARFSKSKTKNRIKAEQNKNSRINKKNKTNKSTEKNRIGIAFSGGVDSALIAVICKKLKLKPTLYTAVLDEPSMGKAPDLFYAERIAKDLGFKLKITKLKLKDIEKRIKIITRLIKDNTVVKIGVGLTIFSAFEAAKKDKVEIMLGGLGAEEIFAGYERHKLTGDVNKECVSGLVDLYKKDLSRDLPIAKHFKIRLESPFLDEKLVRYALTIPPNYKISADENKIPIRRLAEKLGLKKEYAQRKKKAAQYGSKFAKAIQKLSKNAGFSSKAAYLAQFYKKPDADIAALVSSGKDSMFAAYHMAMKNYNLKCFVSLKSKNPDSYMFHTPLIDLVKLQAESAGIPLIFEMTDGKKEHELKDLKNALKKAKDRYKIKGIVTGALFSEYQKQRIEKVCKGLGLKSFAPLWHQDQELVLRHLLKNKFEVILVAIAADGLSKKWLGKILNDKMIEDLKKIHKKIKINIAGEGGEFESLVLDCPLFRKKIKIIESEIVMEKENGRESENTGKFIVKKAELVNK